MDGDHMLLAGAAEADITPDLDIQISGDIGRRRPVEEIREHIFARVLMLDDGQTRFCVVSMELCAVTDESVAEIRQRAAKRAGIETGAILVHAVQNHAAPRLGSSSVEDTYRGVSEELWWLRGGDERYNEPTVAAIVQAIETANARLQPVTVRVGREIDGRAAFNRRFVMRDGTARGHPKPSERKQILYCEGPIDPEVGVVVFEAADGQNVAALLHYTCHPVHGYPHRYIIGDWPGTWASAMRGALGAGCVPLVVNGCCGNIHHNNHLDPTHVNNHIRMGSLLAESAERAMRDLGTQAKPLVAWRSTTLHLPQRILAADEIEVARRYLTEHPDPPQRADVTDAVAFEWDWVYAHCTLDLARLQERKATYDYEVQVLRFADSALVGLQGEPFVEGQLKIKLNSPFAHTFVAHMANGSAGYVPTAEALSRGGYETRTAHWSKLQPDALDVISDEALRLLQELFADGA